MTVDILFIEIIYCALDSVTARGWGVGRSSICAAKCRKELGHFTVILSQSLCIGNDSGVTDALTSITSVTHHSLTGSNRFITSKSLCITGITG